MKILSRLVTAVLWSGAGLEVWLFGEAGLIFAAILVPMGALVEYELGGGDS